MAFWNKWFGKGDEPEGTAGRRNKGSESGHDQDDLMADLTRMGEHMAHMKLLDRLADPDKSVQLEAVRLLDKSTYDNETVVGALKIASKNSDPEVRQAALQALARRGAK